MQEWEIKEKLKRKSLTFEQEDDEESAILRADRFGVRVLRPLRFWVLAQSLGLFNLQWKLEGCCACYFTKRRRFFVLCIFFRLITLLPVELCVSSQMTFELLLGPFSS